MRDLYFLMRKDWFVTAFLFSIMMTNIPTIQKY
jgi:hypothetical protein